MIKIRNPKQLSLLGLEAWRITFSSKKLELLEHSWAGVFRINVLPLLPAEQIFKLYTFGIGRPIKELLPS